VRKRLEEKKNIFLCYKIYATQW